MRWPNGPQRLPPKAGCSWLCCWGSSQDIWNCNSSSVNNQTTGGQEKPDQKFKLEKTTVKSRRLLKTITCRRCTLKNKTKKQPKIQSNKSPTTLQGQAASFSGKGGFFHIPHQGSCCFNLLGKTITECASPSQGQHMSQHGHPFKSLTFGLNYQCVPMPLGQNGQAGRQRADAIAPVTKFSAVFNA